MRQEASKSGYGWLGLAVFVVCVQSYKTGLWPFFGLPLRADAESAPK
jgi:hypothetical protein